MMCVVGLCNMHVTVRVRSTSAVGLFFLDKDDLIYSKRLKLLMLVFAILNFSVLLVGHAGSLQDKQCPLEINKGLCK